MYRTHKVIDTPSQFTVVLRVRTEYRNEADVLIGQASFNDITYISGEEAYLSYNQKTGVEVDSDITSFLQSWTEQ